MNECKVDFNMFILFGMSKDEVYETLKHNLDLRIAGNKAPMQIGWHSDYATPIYDNSTLLSDANKGSYGLSVVNGWNSWEDRKFALERFVDYALGQNAYFYSGKETIEYVKGLVNSPKTSVGSNVQEVKTGWTFTEAGKKDAVAVDGTINQSVTFTDESYWAFFYNTLPTPITATHIEIPSYTNTEATFVGVVFEDGREVSTLLNNLGTAVNSNKILITQLEIPEHNKDQSPVDYTQKIIGITVTPKSRTNVDSNWKFVSKEVANVNIPQINLYTNDKVDNSATVVTAITNVVQSFGIVNNGNQLNLSVPVTGQYSVTLFNTQGRVVSTITAKLNSGSNVIRSFNNVASGAYIINVLGVGGQSFTTKLIK